MKQFIRFTLLLLALQLPETAYTYDIEVDGIFYNVIYGSQLSVTFENEDAYYDPHIDMWTTIHRGYYADSITIPSKVTHNGCQYLVTTIGAYAFDKNEYLESIEIPNSIYCIEDQAFCGCTALKRVFSHITDPTRVSMSSGAFWNYSDNYSDRTLYVPYGTLSAYQADTRWSFFFGSIIEMAPPTRAEAIKLNVTTVGLNEESSFQLTATLQPEECASTNVLWSSNNPSVADVDNNGLVTTHNNVGTAIITAMTTDGSNLSSSCTVTLLPVGVKGDVNGDSNINISDVTTLIDYLLNEKWY